MKALKQRGNNVLKLVHSMTFKKRKKKDVDYGRQKKRMWVESGNAILRREQEDCRGQRLARISSPWARTAKLKAEFASLRILVNQNCRLMDDCIFPDAPPPFAAIILALKFNEPELGALHKQT